MIYYGSRVAVAVLLKSTVDVVEPALFKAFMLCYPLDNFMVRSFLLLKISTKIN